MQTTDRENDSAWIVGIDEAGYGPNLGPFVMTAMPCLIDISNRECDLWPLLADIVRRPGEQRDGRLVVGDSKEIYSPNEGLAELERSVLAITGYTGSCSAFLQLLSTVHLAELIKEHWFRGDTLLPTCESVQQSDWSGSRNGLDWRTPIACVVTPSRFNRIANDNQSKGAVLADCLGALIHAIPDDSRPLSIRVDKHGGRNQYAAMLQDIFPSSVVMAREEGMMCSRYAILGEGREIDIRFEPRADGRYMEVAIASMVSKYLREILMMEFNAFWAAQVPGLQPTAGYPQDAKRFYLSIKDPMARLGISPHQVWRNR